MFNNNDIVFEMGTFTTDYIDYHVDVQLQWSRIWMFNYNGVVFEMGTFKTDYIFIMSMFNYNEVVLEMRTFTRNGISYNL